MIKTRIRKFVLEKWPNKGEVIVRTIQRKYKWKNVVVNNLNYILQPQKRIVVNGFTYSGNFGDALNIPLTKLLFRKTVIEAKLLLFSHVEEILLVGSSIHLANSKTIVCGAGCISPLKFPSEVPKKILAVRGPLTAKILRQNNFECPDIFGDPALLLPSYYNPKVKKQRKYGVIPHYVDRYNENLRELPNNAKIIDVMCGYNWHNFVDEILECECVISSSLHGIIVADAYNIPNIWVEFSDNIDGDRFKFYDYFASVRRNVESPLDLRTCTTIDFSMIDQIVKQWYPIDIDLSKLHTSIQCFI